jgi:predicted CoA-substrate-specific enzyme activase
MGEAGFIVGLDIGARAIKCVRYKDGRISGRDRTPTTFDPMAGVSHVLPDARPDKLIATGFGRDILKERIRDENIFTVSTIHALVGGARHFHPEARTLLDIGGLHTTVIELSEVGELKNHETDSRCAAGTGKFLEFMAQAMQISIDDFGAFALKAKKRITLDQSCTIFAESEAMFRIARGEEPATIAMGMHIAHVDKAMDILRRVGGKPPLLLTGGVAHNPCVRKLLEEQWRGQVIIPEHPDFVAATGAALHVR